MLRYRQTLEKRYKIYYRNIQTQTEEFNGEAISMLHYKNREEQPKDFRKPTLIIIVNFQEIPNGRCSVTANWNSVPILGLRSFK